ncbi:DExH-box splicing factor binding site-domain-containing protein [Morchella snyderi]|nr:DExH-box splicing factor binding site-domain-containing protein [Morchella snyderi]
MADPPPKPSFSLSLGPAKPKPPTRKPPTSFAAKRSAAHLDSDDDEDAKDTHTAKVQLVTAFDATRGGAVDLDSKPAEEKGPLVIPKLSNRNWREEAERRRGGGGAKKAIYLPPEALAKQKGGVKPEDLVETDTIEQKYGLQVFDRAPEDGQEAAAGEAAQTDAPPPPPPPEKQQTEEELALASLLRGDAPAPSTLVLAPAAASAGNDWRAARAAIGNEDAAFKTDVASRPEPATLEDYAAVPVEEFGAALLRGMGWKEGDEVGKRRGAAAKPRVVERRAAFLGIGAKAKEEVVELGTWGKGDKKSRRRRQDTTYVPVVMVDKKTGRVVDPAEAEAMAAAKGADGKRWERGEENARGEAPKRERSRDRDQDRDRDRERDRGGDRDRDRDRREQRGSYDALDRRRRDRERSKDRSNSGKDRDRDRERRRGDDDRNRRRGDDRRRDDTRRDRDRDRDRDRRDRR